MFRLLLQGFGTTLGTFTYFNGGGTFIFIHFMGEVIGYAIFRRYTMVKTKRVHLMVAVLFIRIRGPFTYRERSFREGSPWGGALRGVRVLCLWVRYVGRTWFVRIFC